MKVVCLTDPMNETPNFYPIIEVGQELTVDEVEKHPHFPNEIVYSFREINTHRADFFYYAKHFAEVEALEQIDSQIKEALK